MRSYCELLPAGLSSLLVCRLAVLFCTILGVAPPSHATEAPWSQPLRGSWVRPGPIQNADLVLASGNSGCEIVVAEGEHTAVKQAAGFLAGDIEKISGYKPAITSSPSSDKVAIFLLTIGKARVPNGIERSRLEGQWEAYQILTGEKSVWIVGSNFRGTAFGAYTLSERLGIDPLYHWTGYAPEKRSPLILKKTNFYAGPPTFKFRGLFHDDEDILPRPFDDESYPLQVGVVPRVWYERFFETALRLRLNQVAPYVRVSRPYEIQKLAGDWGLFYSSHHYDALLSNPWGFERFGLGRARKAGDRWDWLSNREGLKNFWRGGVLENRELDCIWPLGLRGTQDRNYEFPPGTTEEEKIRTFQEALNAQVGLVRELLPPGKTPLFHFTLYGEMLQYYQSGKLELPEDAILVWTDDGDGVMRALPRRPARGRHGVYYHLAFYGRTTKQTTHTVTPMRIADQFRNIVAAGATEYVLVNVSELREFVMETRMIADLGWDAPAALRQPDLADRFLGWWCREYFGESAAGDAAEAYRRYYQLLDTHDKLWYGAMRLQEALASLEMRLRGKAFPQISVESLETLRGRHALHQTAREIIARAAEKMDWQQQQFFFEHAALGLLFDGRPTEAALMLLRALDAEKPDEAWKLSVQAREPLEKLEIETLRAERPPFEGWYRPTWIRKRESWYNVHRSYEQLRAFLAANGSLESVH